MRYLFTEDYHIAEETKGYSETLATDSTNYSIEDILICSGFGRSSTTGSK